MSQRVGGFSEKKDATPDIQEYCEKVKPELENKMGTNFGTFKAESYISQVVAGLNCIVKVNIGGGSCVHIKIFVPLPHTNEGPQLNGYQPSKTLTDPIKDF
ncbi:cystatin-A1-like isoform X2 [Pleurodeles waltl]|uniref:cystatin-A1-like isoform X2 n=1 Tax=Pleurodeles waltl TaxID=8319 RepID=UPI003709B97B